MKLLKHLKVLLARVIITVAYPIGAVVIVLAIMAALLLRGSLKECAQQLLKELRELSRSYAHAIRDPLKSLNLD